MSKNDFDRLFDRFSLFSVGFDPIFREFHIQTSSGYPPHNIKSLEDEKSYMLELALAGFEKDELSVEQNQGLLVIKGVKKETPSESYQFRGIANRDFEKRFTLAEFIEIDSISLKNGMLYVKLVKNIPEEKKPRKFNIT